MNRMVALNACFDRWDLNIFILYPSKNHGCVLIAATPADGVFTVAFIKSLNIKNHEKFQKT
jgi:hypothetical protein